MKVVLVSIAARVFTGHAQQMVEEYVRRTQPYLPVEALVLRSEAAFFEWLEKLARQKARTAPVVVLLDARGKQVRSEELAALVDREKQAATQVLVFAIGPADGWSAGAAGRVALLEMGASGTPVLSLGPMTLPHELARLVLVEQVYRAATILAGHPYHAGH